MPQPTKMTDIGNLRPSDYPYPQIACPALLCERDAAIAERDGLHALHNKNAAYSAELLELCRTLRKERDELRAENEILRSNKLSDPLLEVTFKHITAERDRLADALGDYMSAFGQALEAYDIPMGEQQVEADAAARSALTNQPK